ncbi:MAG: HPP family protein [Sulfuritalea sp.]|jgi:CBS domain-containing membrane protein|nr:HPP family protein [Sulfuritalea sp.]MBK8760441.1 HPP family protein [Sulfuritalea sp.]MBK9349241.1 HPP family protein [Sulfuritalea sp.]MBP6637734.1 HPP family protein [Sulfuritalea sp.]MBP7422817.1 HPP family protein [Sulfuritalea sp.]
MSTPRKASSWLKLLGIEFSPISHRERLVSALGGFVAIFAVYGASRWVLGATVSPFLVLSMGSTAVMLFAVPHGALSQPWPLLGGHLVSGLLGIACLLWIPQPMLAASVAIGLALGAMHYLRCIHPPAGATALAAALGDETVRAMGFGFVVAPLMLNVLIILGIAVAFNGLFPWRRYPAALVRPAETPAPMVVDTYAAISHEDFVYALTQLDSIIDVSEEDLLRIYALATGRHRDLEAQAAAERVSPSEPA